MRVVVLEYHDVVDGSEFDATGFPGASANSYKVTTDDFRAHLRALRDGGCTVINDVHLLPRASQQPMPVLFSFDDGGSSSMRSAALLEEHGWRGHYFIPSACVGTRAFLGASDLRELRSRGHVIGSHSHSHPLQMGRLSPAAVHDEWSRSVAMLEDLLGERADVASVPGGYYRPFIAESASACGIRWLFSSEPVRAVETVQETHVLGRYTIRRDAAPGYVRSLTESPSLARAMQWSTWNLKKVAKRLGGNTYLRIRAAIFRESAQPEAPTETGDRRPSA